MKHESSSISLKYNHRRALKDISEALEQNLSSSKDISEAHSLINSDSCVSLPKGVYSKDDCGELKRKYSNHTRCSKQNTSCGE